MVGAITSFSKINWDNVDHFRAGFLNHSVKTSCFARPVTGARSKNLIISMGRIVQGNDINKALGKVSAIKFGFGGTADKLNAAKNNIARAIISKEFNKKGIPEDKLVNLMKSVLDKGLYNCTSISGLRRMVLDTMDEFALKNDKKTERKFWDGTKEFTEVLLGYLSVDKKHKDPVRNMIRIYMNTHPERYENMKMNQAAETAMRDIKKEFGLHSMNELPSKVRLRNDKDGQHLVPNIRKPAAPAAGAANAVEPDVRQKQNVPE